ncbi:hypothetical protein [Oricola thermophila]|uniref:Uncharacterized protein n=1 Tax=Oricola thermophila TaxID=2742145 RepID=A0A6N1VA95_9HYPH|nr:hypothetical protein [Oricola thermophila]QKV17870.1 hypothetical protein HTY61_05045 [Oricola thermophila]
MTANERERLAVLETQVESLLKQVAKMNDKLDDLDKKLTGSKAFRLGLLTALPLGGGGIGAWLQSYFGSGGPTGTH